jgi:hypothetical protein
MIDVSNPNFVPAKQCVIHGIKKLTKFASNMDIKYPNCGFRPHIQKLKS